MNHPDTLFQDLETLLRREARGGVISVPPEVAAWLERATSAAAGTTARTAAPAPGGVEEADDERAAALTALAAVVSGCEKCGLHRGRTQTVFGVGNPRADLVFVGEAPGADEDRQGEPFVGRAGALLTKIIENGMKLRREDVYICNVVKCRPENNRDPAPEEKHACEPYLLKQLELIRPKAICALGRHAAQTLLRTDTPIGRLRGQWHEFHGIPLRVTYHPAYLLRNPEDKKKTWQDIQEIMKRLANSAE